MGIESIRPSAEPARTPAPSAGRNPDPTSGPLEAKQPPTEPWDGRTGLRSNWFDIPMGMFVGGALTIIPAALMGYFGGTTGLAVGTAVVGVGMLFGATGMMKSDRDEAKRAWVADREASRDVDLKDLIHEFMATHDAREQRDEVIRRPDEWKSDSVGPASRSYYLDYTKLMQGIDQDKDDQVTLDEVVNHFRSFDANRNGGLDDAEWKNLLEWQDDNPVVRVDTGYLTRPDRTG